ncbi:hypothetical protein DUI87_22508 [Hirundo rustica rustica]|uniref:Uncharacterized protein n=1 Tax=Hirundo rustica rustica TaxID=333673 RepID=A0A3M0JP41_HIRRU|nr:hypothetical protein DUI87_22508 [Hirundo rustica rustica]
MMPLLLRELPGPRSSGPAASRAGFLRGADDAVPQGRSKPRSLKHGMELGGSTGAHPARQEPQSTSGLWPDGFGGSPGKALCQELQLCSKAQNRTRHSRAEEGAGSAPDPPSSAPVAS